MNSHNVYIHVYNYIEAIDDLYQKEHKFFPQIKYGRSL